MGFNVCGFCFTGTVNTLDPAQPIVTYENKAKLLEDYDEGRKLGEGMFAKVRLMTRKSDGKIFAAKVMKKHMSISDNNEVFGAPAPKTLLREVKLLQKLGGQKQCLRLEFALETPRDFYVLTDVCAGGELMKHLDRCASFVEQDASRFFAHFCGAIAHCHANHISHRDIKPENLLVDFEQGGRTRVVLADFGSACEFAPETRWRSEAGSPFWQSPEVWALDYDHRADVYSCGVVLLVLTHGMLTAGEIRSLHGAGLEGLLRFRKTYGKKDDVHSEDLMDLLRGLLRPEGHRLTAREALASPWLTKSSGKTLPNPAAAALALRALVRAAKTCVALLDDAPRAKLREALARAPTPGLPADCALLGDVVRALDTKDDSAAAATLRALHPDPDLVLLHRPLALEAAYVTKRAEEKEHAMQKRQSLPIKCEIKSPARTSSLTRTSSLARKNLSSPDLFTLGQQESSSSIWEFGRTNAPGATDDAANMDGTYHGSEALMMDASVASKVSAGSFEDAGSVGALTPVESVRSLADLDAPAPTTASAV